MTVWQIVLTVVGVLLALVLLCAVTVWLERKFPSANYDERQKQARGRAYRVSFWTGTLYYFIVMAILIFQVDATKLIEPYLLLFFGLMIQVMVLHFYCILTHAAIPLSEKPGTAGICYLVMGILYWFTNDYSKPVSLVGHSSMAVIRLTSAVLFLALAAMHLFQFLRDRKE